MIFLIRPVSIMIVFAILGVLIWAGFFVAVPIMAADCRARCIDHSRISMQKFSERSARYVGLSWCGRGVGISAWGDDAKKLYKDIGYKWWHILPDGFPMVFARLSFWKSVLGIK